MPVGAWQWGASQPVGPLRAFVAAAIKPRFVVFPTKISGRIRSENIESFVEALEANFNVVAERRTEGEIVLKRR